MRILETISKLKQLQKGSPDLELFYVGGFVRDIIKQIPPKDVDIVAKGIPEPELYQLLRENGDVQLVGASFGVFLFRSSPQEDYVEIAMPRKEVSTGPGHRDFEIIMDPKLTLKEDSSRRDFTVNSLYLPLEFSDPSKEVISYFKGTKHLEQGIITFVGDPAQRIYEDPIRILRAFTLMSKGFRISGLAKRAISGMAYMLEEASVERIRTELERILLSDRPSRILKPMFKLGVLGIILPELASCVGITQSKKYHRHDVFDHCLYACDNTQPELTLRLAALLHDLGKPDVRELRKGRYTFYNHVVFSERKAAIVLKRLRFSNHIIKEVLFLVSNHMYHYERRWTPKAIRRFIKQVGLTKTTIESDLENFPLFSLRKADRLGSGFKTTPVTQRQIDFENRIREVFKESSALRISDLRINGLDLMKTFGLKPSVLIGQILRRLLDEVLENPQKNEREELLEMAKKILKNISEGR